MSKKRFGGKTIFFAVLAVLPVSTNPLLTYLAFASVRVFACFVPLIFVVLRSSFYHTTLETFLRFCLRHVRLDFSLYDCSSKATLATFSIVVLMIQVFYVCFIEFDSALAVGTSVRELFRRMRSISVQVLLLYTRIALLVAVLAVVGGKIFVEEFPVFYLLK